MILKSGGFITGAGHGSTFQDKDVHWWHIGTVVNWIKHTFERRLGNLARRIRPRRHGKRPVWVQVPHSKQPLSVVFFT